MANLIRKCVFSLLNSNSHVITPTFSPKQRFVTSLTANKPNREKVLETFADCFNSEHIHFLPSSSSHQWSNPNLVVLCGWLDASEKNLNKYVSLWHSKNVDVLRVKTHWMDLFVPVLSMEPNATKVANCLQQISPSIYPNIIFHTFSSGAYFYASVLEAIKQDPNLISTLPAHLKGVIFDSLANWFYVLTSEAALCEMARTIVPSHDMMPVVKLIERLTEHPEHHSKFLHVQFFHHLNELIKQNPFELPGLLLYSHADPLTNVEENVQVKRYWKQRGFPIQSKCWNSVPHVQLFKEYPQEYSMLLDKFAKEILSKQVKVHL